MHIWNEIRPHPFQASALWYLIIMTWKWVRLKPLFLAMITTALDEEIRNAVYFFFKSEHLTKFIFPALNEQIWHLQKYIKKCFWATYKRWFCRVLSVGCPICSLMCWRMVLVFMSWVWAGVKITRTGRDLVHRLVWFSFDRGDWRPWAEVTCRATP